MKIVHSLRQAYKEREPLYKKLKVEVDNAIDTLKNLNWHYESRIKSEESFALKAETGFYDSIVELEDFFAGCIVVENIDALKKAEERLKERFTLVERRPKNPKFTSKEPTSFIFDDIRLYLKITTDEMLPAKVTDEIVFEIQIKTFLQHAWSIATHDLIYKGDKLSWSSSRIAYQVKAMLEHAELSISSANMLSVDHQIQHNDIYDRSNTVISILNKYWGNDFLPKDIIRLSNNILLLLKSANLGSDDLQNICEESQFIGASPSVNLSPYLAIAQSILQYRPNAIAHIAGSNFKLFLPPEILTGLSKDILDKLDNRVVTI